MIKWIKPSGVEVETNDAAANVEAAENLGWQRVDDAEAKALASAQALAKKPARKTVK